MIRIDEVVNSADITDTHEVMSELRPGYTRDCYRQFVAEQLLGNGVRMAALREGDTVKAVVTFRISASLAWGKFIYVDDLVTMQNGRSSGFGKTLLDWVCDRGREAGCAELHLDSGVQRHAAHRFYLRERMDIVFYHFKKAL